MLAHGCHRVSNQDTSEFLGGLLAALEAVALCQAGGGARLDARSKVGPTLPGFRMIRHSCTLGNTRQ